MHDSSAMPGGASNSSKASSAGHTYHTLGVAQQQPVQLPLFPHPGVVPPAHMAFGGGVGGHAPHVFQQQQHPQHVAAHAHAQQRVPLPQHPIPPSHFLGNAHFSMPSGPFIKPEPDGTFALSSSVDASALQPAFRHFYSQESMRRQQRFSTGPMTGPGPEASSHSHAAQSPSSRRSRSSESDEQRAMKLAYRASVVREKRHAESPDERGRRREREAERKRQRRAAESMDQQEARRRHQADLTRMKRANESPETRRARLARQAERMRMRRRAEHPDDRAKRLAYDAERMRRMRARESPETRRRRLLVCAEKARDRRKRESPETRAKRLVRGVEYKRNRTRGSGGGPGSEGSVEDAARHMQQPIDLGRGAVPLTLQPFPPPHVARFLPQAAAVAAGHAAKMAMPMMPSSMTEEDCQSFIGHILELEEDDD